MDHNDSNPNSPRTTEAISQQASVWMKRGLALLNAGTTASLTEAVAGFDRAIALRQQLPLAANPKFRYGLAAGWLNRGDALTRLGGATHLAEALRSFDEALKLLNTLPLDADPLFRRRLAIAWQNRGLVLQNQNDAAALVEAEKSFTNAIAVLQNERANEILDRNQILATIWMNRANALIFQKSADAAVAARAAAKQTLILVAPIETDDLGAAEAGFKARHVLCQAIAQLLTEKDVTNLDREHWIAEATDAVDDGMKLARAWEQRGVKQFRPLAFELFRFGARIYQIYQPHFLNEFLLENFNPENSPDAFVGNPEMHAAALESLWRAFHEIQRHGFKTINTPEFDELLERLRELRVVEERLTELRRHYLKKE